MFCPVEFEGRSPLARRHEYVSGAVVGEQVNVTSFDATTVELAGLAVTPVIKFIFISHEHTNISK